jgi:hypothetical protein
MYSAQGYQQGLAQAMAGDSIARSMTKPMNQFASSQQQTNVINFPSGLTSREVNAIFDRRSEDLVMSLGRAIGGA